MRPWVLLLLLAASTNSISGTAPITAKNWVSHPHILEIRRLYEDIENSINTGLFRCQAKSLEIKKPHNFSVVDICFGPQRKARRFIREGGAGNTRATRCFYYDKQGNLRFLFIKATAPNSTKIEHRVYFDKAGKRIWETQKQLSGPGYNFPKVWYNDDLVTQPWAVFNAK